MLKETNTLYHFLKEYGHLSYDWDYKNGEKIIITDTCKIFNAILRGILFLFIVIIIGTLFTIPLALSIAETIAQLNHGFVGLGAGQQMMIVIFVGVGLLTAYHLISKMSGKSESLNTIKETIASKAGKYCKEVRIIGNEN
jgi:hypothetical protein